MRLYLQYLIVALLVACMTFATVPALDLWVSELFFDPARGGFWLAQNSVAWTIRRVLMNAMILFPIVALAFLLLNLWKRNLAGVTPRVWGRIVLLFVLGPGILVNAILKNHWGRARPAYVEEFGGTSTFTPPFQITDQCLRNCSFVSGEGAGAVAAAIGIFALTATMKNQERAKRWRIFAVCFAIVGSSMRVAMGRHFISDTIFSALFILLLAYAIDAVMERRSKSTLVV
ncbi:phosphatase PAP2 family protein [Falsihalocynthiibacter sp. SS001]|uniref:phosphatase PAP2 family protein n=1 Tax=Falsihalocynthiibacter sp. SS001 TaxID=3349698 RepID=UPI0036D3E5B5